MNSTISKFTQRPPNGRITWLALALLTSGCGWFMNNVIERLEKIEEKVSDHRAHILSMESKIDDRDSRLDRIESKIDSLIERRYWR